MERSQATTETSTPELSTPPPTGAKYPTIIMIDHETFGRSLFEVSLASYRIAALHEVQNSVSGETTVDSLSSAKSQNGILHEEHNTRSMFASKEELQTNEKLSEENGFSQGRNQFGYISKGSDSGKARLVETPEQCTSRQCTSRRNLNRDLDRLSTFAYLGKSGLMNSPEELAKYRFFCLGDKDFFCRGKLSNWTMEHDAFEGHHAEFPNCGTENHKVPIPRRSASSECADHLSGLHMRNEAVRFTTSDDKQELRGAFGSLSENNIRQHARASEQFNRFGSYQTINQRMLQNSINGETTANLLSSAERRNDYTGEQHTTEQLPEENAFFRDGLNQSQCLYRNGGLTDATSARDQQANVSLPGPRRLSSRCSLNRELDSTSESSLNIDQQEGLNFGTGETSTVSSRSDGMVHGPRSREEELLTNERSSDEMIRMRGHTTPKKRFSNLPPESPMQEPNVQQDEIPGCSRDLTPNDICRSNETACSNCRKRKRKRESDFSNLVESVLNNPTKKKCTLRNITKEGTIEVVIEEIRPDAPNAQPVQEHAERQLNYPVQVEETVLTPIGAEEDSLEIMDVGFVYDSGF